MHVLTAAKRKRARGISYQGLTILVVNMLRQMLKLFEKLSRKVN
jgi:hypothetical protein